MTTKTKFQAIDLLAYRGDTEQYTFSVSQNGTGVNLETYTLAAEGKTDYDAVTKLFHVPITDSAGGNQFNVGKVVLTLHRSVTALLPDSCRYDIQATAGEVYTTLAHGLIATLRDITG